MTSTSKHSSRFFDLLSLPIEIQEKILSNCNFQLKLKLTETCKYFNDLIFNNSTLCGNIRLIVFCRDYWGNINEQTMETINLNKRNYRKLHITSAFEDKVDFELMKALKVIGEYVKEVEICFCFFPLKTWKQLLGMFNKAEKIVLNSATIQESDRSGDEQLAFPRLKVLELEAVSIEFLDIFKEAHEIDSLVLKSNWHSSKEAKTMENFLLSREKMKKLNLEYCYDFMLFRDVNEDDIKFRLNACNIAAPVHSKFLKTQIETLENLEFTFNKQINANTRDEFVEGMKLIMKSKKLQKLSVGEDFQIGINDLEGISNSSVKFLTFKQKPFFLQNRNSAEWIRNKKNMKYFTSKFEKVKQPTVDNVYFNPRLPCLEILMRIQDIDVTSFSSTSSSTSKEIPSRRCCCLM